MLVEDRTERTWRDSWFAKNVMAELPIIGAYFKKCSNVQMFHHAGKDVCMIAGSAAGMYIAMTEHSDMNMNMSDANTFTQMVVGMTVGMTGGAIAYNSLVGLGKVTYQGCRGKSSDEEELALPVEAGRSTTPYSSF